MTAALLLFSILFSVSAVASDEVLWQPQAAKVPAEVVAAEQRLQQQPNNLSAAAPLIRRYLDVVRQSGNHTMLEKARQVAARLADHANGNDHIPWLVARADLLQYQHQFDAASRLLTRAVQVQPGHLQASLMLARIALAQDHTDRAQSHCASLFGQHALGIVSTCLLEVKGRAEQPQLAYQKLKQLQQRHQQQGDDGVITQWRLQILASQALALGYYQEARHWLKQLPQPHALVEQKMLLDSYLFDEQSTPPKQLITSCEQDVTDSIAVRLAYAQQQSQAGDCWLDYAHQRMRLRELRNDTLHSADIAYYYSYVNPNAKAALKWAKINYAVAKEPFDAQLLARAQQLNQSESYHD